MYPVTLQCHVVGLDITVVYYSLALSLVMSITVKMYPVKFAKTKMYLVTLQCHVVGLDTTDGALKFCPTQLGWTCNCIGLGNFSGYIFAWRIVSPMLS
jgi:hypothetical protein